LPDNKKIQETKKVLFSKCDQCGKVLEENQDLAFLEKLDQPKTHEKSGKIINSTFYCGCFGWN